METEYNWAQFAPSVRVQQVRRMTQQLTEWVAIGCRVKLIRGAESLTIEKAGGAALWCYYTGNVGDSQTVSPLEVLGSQIEAHLSEGWEIDPGNPYG